MVLNITLPAPFVMPLFIDEADQENRTFVVNTLSLSTVVTLVAFAIISLVYVPSWPTGPSAESGYLERHSH